MIVSLEKIFTTYSSLSGETFPWYDNELNSGTGPPFRAPSYVVKIELGTFEPGVRVKYSGAGCGAVVVRRVTCRWTYGCSGTSGADESERRLEARETLIPDW